MKIESKNPGKRTSKNVCCLTSYVIRSLKRPPQLIVSGALHRWSCRVEQQQCIRERLGKINKCAEFCDTRHHCLQKIKRKTGRITKFCRPTTLALSVYLNHKELQ